MSWALNFYFPQDMKIEHWQTEREIKNKLDEFKAEDTNGIFASFSTRFYDEIQPKTLEIKDDIPNSNGDGIGVIISYICQRYPMVFGVGYESWDITDCEEFYLIFNGKVKEFNSYDDDLGKIFNKIYQIKDYGKTAMMFYIKQYPYCVSAFREIKELSGLEIWEQFEEGEIYDDDLLEGLNKYIKSTINAHKESAPNVSKEKALPEKQPLTKAPAAATLPKEKSSDNQQVKTPNKPKESIKFQIPQNIQIKNGELLKYSADENEKNILIPAVVKKIAEGAFEGCSNIQNVKIPEGVTHIGDYAFNGCHSLCSVLLPKSLECIGDGAFQDCDNLQSIQFHNGLVSIGEDAFNDCTALKISRIPESVTAVGECAFFGCKASADKDGMVIIRNKLYSYHGVGGAVTIPDRVTSIGAYAFDNCEQVESITMPDHVKNIGPYAFYRCYNLRKIQMPSLLVGLEKAVFAKCCSLEEITMPNNAAYIGDFAFLGCEKLHIVYMMLGIKRIGERAFEKCRSLSLMYISDETTLGEKVFNGCESIELLVTKGSPAETYARENNLKYTVRINKDKEESKEKKEAPMKTRLTLEDKKAILDEMMECGRKNPAFYFSNLASQFPDNSVKTYNTWTKQIYGKTASVYFVDGGAVMSDAQQTAYCQGVLDELVSRYSGKKPESDYEQLKANNKDIEFFYIHRLVEGQRIYGKELYLEFLADNGVIEKIEKATVETMPVIEKPAEENDLQNAVQIGKASDTEAQNSMKETTADTTSKSKSAQKEQKDTVTDDASNKDRWYLSSLPMQASLEITLPDGKQYKYRARKKAAAGDIVVIGRGFKSSGQMGVVKKVLDRSATVKSHTAEAMYNFSKNPDAETLKKSASGILSMDSFDQVNKKFNLNVDKFAYVDSMVEVLLNSATVLAFPELSTKAARIKAIDCLSQKKTIPGFLYGESMQNAVYFRGYWMGSDDSGYPEYVCYPEVIYSGYYPEWEKKFFALSVWGKLEKIGAAKLKTLDKFLLDAIKQHYLEEEAGKFKIGKVENNCVVYGCQYAECEKLMNEDAEYNEACNELIFRSALSILIRGGYLNLLEAFLSANPPISAFSGELIKYAEDLKADDCVEVLNKYLG